MRVTVLIAGLLLGAIMFLQTFLVSALGSAAQDQRSEQAGSIGLMMAFLWLIACAFVMPLPMVSVVLFVVAGLLGFAYSGDFSDLAIWSGISLALAVLKQIPAKRLANETGLALSTVKAARNVHTNPHGQNQQALISIAGAFARELLQDEATKPVADNFTACATYLASTNTR